MQTPKHLVREKAMATHSSILAWKIPWTKEPGRLQSMGSRRVGQDWATSLSLSIWLGAKMLRNFFLLISSWMFFSWLSLIVAPLAFLSITPFAFSVDTPGKGNSIIDICRVAYDKFILQRQSWSSWWRGTFYIKTSMFFFPWISYWPEGLDILTTILSVTSIVQQGVLLLKKEVSRGRAPAWPGLAEKTFQSPLWKVALWWNHIHALMFLKSVLC